jgi:phosphate transport system permease protein
MSTASPDPIAGSPSPVNAVTTVEPARPAGSGDAGGQGHDRRPEDGPLLVGRRSRGFLSGDPILRLITGGSAVTVLLMLAALMVVLTIAAMPSIREYGFKFLVSTDWRPNELEVPRRDPVTNKMVRDADGEPIIDTIPPAFGALNVIYGTTLSSVIALAFAVPLSLGAAIFLVRVAPAWLVPPVSFLVEFLAAIPSIAYGIWGLFVLAPFLQSHVEPGLQSLLGGVPGFAWLFQQTIETGSRTTVRPIPLTGRDMFSGGLILAIMVIPIITAISRDVLRGVPRAQVEGTVALGATWWQSCKEMLKYSRSGLFGAIMLGLARAAGETMAVTMVIGNKNQIEPSPFAPAQTMSSLLANEFAEVTGDMHRAALVEVALVLLGMSLLFNVVARYLVVGGQSRSAAAH